MMLLALLLQATSPETGPDIIVRGRPNGPPPSQVPATIVVEPAAMMIAACDANGDAMVDHAELDECLEKSFRATPGVRDDTMGYIAYGDWALKWLGDRAALPSPYDVDRDNDDKVTLVELQDHFAKLFNRFDADRDRLLSRAELLTFKTMPIGANGPTSPPDGAKPSPRGERGKPRR